MLEEQIPHLEHTMAVALLYTGSDSGGRMVNGALLLHVPSGALITARAKAVILATGGGSDKPTGNPTGGAHL